MESEGDLDKYASDIARSRRRGDLENLLATELALATNSVDPLLKIRHILEAFMLLNDEEKDKILPGEDDKTLFERNYTLTLALLNVTPTHDSVHSDRAMIPFAFAPDKAWIFLDGFLTVSWDLSGYFKEFDRSFVQDRTSCTPEQVQEYYSRLATFLMSGDASLGICLTIKSLFVKDSLPWTLKILRKIFTQFVSPELWTEITTSISTGKGSRGKEA